MRGVSLFSSAGIAETYLDEVGIDIKVANEIIPSRAALYQSIYPSATMITGDIQRADIFTNIIQSSEGAIDFLIASPPCQGLSVAGKNRNNESMLKDERNYLFYKIVEFIHLKKPAYILIENVPSLLKLLLPYKEKLVHIQDILQNEFGGLYNIEAEIVDAANYDVPQKRLRAIIKMYKKGTTWAWPAKKKAITVLDAIGHLPSIESGETSSIPWHFARKHVEKHITWMKHTPTGKSAFFNKVHYPQKEDGTRIKGYESTYRRINWDKPAPTITIRNDAISSQRNVHPGRLKEDGTYSDARVLTPLELMILSSLPTDWKIPQNTPEILIRQCIGESIPPKMINNLLQGIN
ncbi:DNA (cytosine-5-)-methyltransferase [Pontibacter burrus]|uniref:DNA (cytosine-5-)-methyltransferase n=1 Tax=Pontibacter burrus TaxID=2704466 RepID=A0A6B3LN65_9BACT|nr:DNA (cytosine-5-)-methyltransferase [Pontibacter burrus]NEM98352.1 DNA cytosine methyltransferase [Pontibacter burrus]